MAHHNNKPTLAQYATSSHEYLSCVRSAAAFVEKAVGRAEFAIVLGSGLMDFVDKFHQNPKPVSVDYASVPFMPGTNVPGHSGKIYVGELPTKAGPRTRVMCFAGRVHAYEGWNSTEFNFIVRLAHSCGVKVLVLTNSAGGALAGMTEGSIMMIEDHLRFSGINPLKDVCDDPRFGPKYCTSSKAYSKRIQGIVREAAAKLKMDVLAGTYCWTSGPSYETPSEVKAGQVLSVNSLGGAFGMSTVPEVLAAHNLGMEVFAVSLCTNLAAGLSDKELTHGDVKVVAEMAGPRFQNLLLEMFANLDVVPDLAKQVLPTTFDASQVNQIASIPSTGLYPVSGWTPSLQQINESVQFISTVIGSTESLSTAVFFLGGRNQHAAQATFLSSLSHAQSVPLREISSVYSKYPATLSSYARSALLVFGKVGAKNVVALVSGDGNNICGLSSSEYSHLVQVLDGLGVTSIIASVVGVNTMERTIGGAKAGTAAAERILLLEDVFDRQVDPLPLTVVVTKNASSEFPTLFDLSLNSQLQSALLEIDGSKKDVVKAGSYLSFQGPMLPTEAELNLAHHAGAVSSAGISNLSFVEVAKEIGIPVAVVVRTVDQVSKISEDHHSSSSSSEAKSSDLIARALIKVVESGAAVARPNAASSSVSASQVALGYGPVACFAKPEPFDLVTASAAWIASKLGSTKVKSFIIAEGMLNDIFGEDFKTTTEFSVLDVPHFADFLGINSTAPNAAGTSGACFPYDPRVLMSSWRFRVGSFTSTGSSVLLLSNDADRTGLVPVFHGLNYLIRCAKYLQNNGVTNVLLLPTLASCDVSVAPQSLVLVKDHINFTGLNPLFGENTIEFGPRFNDMSQVYKGTGLASFHTQDEAIPTTVTVQVTNPSLSSLSEANLCRSIHATTLTSGFAPVSTLCKHMDVFVTALGYVYRTAGANDSASVSKTANYLAAMYSSVTRPSPATISKMRSLVIGAVDKLHDAGLVHIDAVKRAAGH